jgi:pyruvate dehydrogenase E2 component (dihydrolipoamide acetyltransferase)
MAIVTMPALSPTMTEGKLSKWLVQEGDDVRSGDVIAEIETDKAVMEVEALDDGKITTILIAEGTEGVAVGTTIAEILGDGEDSALSSSAQDKTAPVSPAAVSVAQPADEAKQEQPAPVTPAAKVTANASPPVQSGDRVFASPLARRIAQDRGIDLASLKGSGPRGRIIKADLEQVASVATTKSMTIPMPAPSGDESSVTEHTQMRKVIADRLQQSMQDSPHFYVNMDIDIGKMLAARKALNNHAPEGVKISVNDMIIKAAATALMRVPEVNASWEGTQTRRFHHADISVAVAIEGGLITPIIRHADEKGLEAISSEVAALAKKAHDGKLAPEEYTGGSFTISNLGMFGVTSFTAVINPPQAAILAIGAGEERAVVRDGQLAVATMMTATLSSDHRVIDGATAARFMKVFKDIVENPVLALA